MVEFQKNKWKYTTISLMAILAAGFSFPQAFAAPIDSVLSIVKDIQTRVNDSNNGLPAVNAQLDEIQAAIAQPSLPGTLFTRETTVSLDSGENSGIEHISVPEGKILVIETVTGHVSIPTGQVPFVQILADGNNDLVPVFIGSTATKDEYAFHQPTRLYESSGDDEIHVQFSRSGSDGEAFVSARITGYLVDSP